MPLDFPNSPTLGQVYTAANKSWTWDGSKWIVTQYNNAIDDDVVDYIDSEIDAVRNKSVAFSLILG